MKLYTSIGSNPKVVRMFLAEKGVTIPSVTVDIHSGENREPAFLQKNPMGQVPVLELDDGTTITEVTAICEYLEEIYPETPLLGTDPTERALTRMWSRRLDLAILQPMASGYRYGEGLAFFSSRMRCIPAAAPDLKRIAQDGLAWLEGVMSDRSFVVGDRISLADIMLYANVAFFARLGQPLDASHASVHHWLDAMRQRASARA
jgi:glutathione S-transferase